MIAKARAYLEFADKCVDVANKAADAGNKWADVTNKNLDNADKFVGVLDHAVPVVGKAGDMILNLADKTTDTACNIVDKITDIPGKLIDKVTDIPFKIVDKFKNGCSTSQNMRTELNEAINSIKDVEVRQNVAIENLQSNFEKLGGIVENHEFRIGKSYFSMEDRLP